jgi:drug/metabolite transporter (DMT)-like permease
MTRPLIVLAIGVIAASFAAIFIRLADAPPLVVAATRLGLASLILLPLAWGRVSQEVPLLPRKSLFLALFSGVVLALHCGLWITSLSHTSVTTSVVLVTADPVFVAVASYLFLGEKVSGQAVAGMAVCAAGVVLIGYANWQQGAGSLYGAGLALGAALAVAGYVMLGRKLRRNVGLLAYISLAYTTAALLLIVAVLASGHSFMGYSGRTYLMMVLLALIPQLLGHTSLNWSLRYIPAALATIAFLGEPVLSSLWAVVILHEVPIAMEILGGFVVIAGIFAAFYKKPAPRTPKPPG